MPRTRILNGNQQVGGDRPDKHNVTILLTDGESNRDAGLTIPEAQTSKNEGTSLLVVGIGNKVQLAEVTSIASYPVHDYLFLTSNFDNLPTIGNRVLDVICRIASMPPPMQCPPRTSSTTTTTRRPPPPPMWIPSPTPAPQWIPDEPPCYVSQWSLVLKFFECLGFWMRFNYLYGALSLHNCSSSGSLVFACLGRIN